MVAVTGIPTVVWDGSTVPVTSVFVVDGTVADGSTALVDVDSTA